MKGGQYAVIAVAAVGLLVGAGLIVVFATMNKKGNDADYAGAAGEPGRSPAAGEFDGLDDSGGSDVAGNTSAPAGPLTAEQQKAIVQSIRQWKDVTAVRAITVRDVARISVTDAWISSSLTGNSRDTAWQAGRRIRTVGVLAGWPTERAVFVADAGSQDDSEGTIESAEPEDSAAAPESEASEANAEADAPSTSASGPRYVFIKVSVTCNKPAESLSYVSWNGYGDIPGKTAAILADDAGGIWELVPYEKSSDARRVRTASIGPGKELVDLLVFQAPAGSFETLRLVLPKAGIGLESSSPYFAVEIPRTYLNRSPKKDLAKLPDVRGGIKVRGAGTGDPDEPGIDPIARGIREGMGKDGSGEGSSGGDVGQFEVPAGDLAGSDDDGGADGDSPFPKTGSVGGDGNTVSPNPREDVPEDIRDLIKDAGGGNPDEEAKPFDSDRIEK